MPRRSGPILGITMGDPCGVGPQVALQAVRTARAAGARVVLIGDAGVFAAAARRLGGALPGWPRARPGDRIPRGAHRVILLECGQSRAFRRGRPDAAAGAASIGYVDEALRLWRSAEIDALVTGPVTKWAIQLSRPDFVGHTEYLARALGVRDVVMLFVSRRLRVALATRHVALAAVPGAVTRAFAGKVLTLTAEGLRLRFGIAHPRLAVCGLNPHAGEGGAFGREEQRVLAPAMRDAQARGVRCEGPFSADGFFARPGACDAVVCWYHDQGLIPFKMASRGAGCQTTLGLPLVRTSPDHGSALDLAARGTPADSGGMRAAAALAVTLATGCARPN
ncbi:MAG TPA: 4-hydroxythreonine-4-phosphate dehydrogenase PdxA [bacterium]